ncbi:MAG TPA: hypothetical protein ENN13_04250 [Candidatus Altiarchaeales archaeon]|nr:hypothetical protein [Candidatus Altiarchaeales archaeon]
MKAVKRISPLFVLLNAGSVCAQTDAAIQPLFFAGILFGVLAIAYAYHVTQSKNGLEAKISAYKKVLARQRQEIEENEARIMMQRRDLGLADEQEVRKVDSGMSRESRSGGSNLRDEFWHRLAKIDVKSKPVDLESLESLLNQKREIEEMIDLSKAKYHTRALDEEGFNEITREYQKKLIEIESKIRKFKEE